jgi:hypothetical protein
MTEPLTPAGLDLRDFDWMPLDVMRLRDSDLSVLATGDAFRAAVLLWCAAWHQVPAGSLPGDNRLQANLAGYGRDLDGWATVKADAMRGFVECSDGRFYHPIVCGKAIEADEQRNKQRKRTQAATSARRNGQRDEERNGSHDDKCVGERNEVHPTLPNPTLPKESKTPAKEQARASDDFENLKKSYPRRAGNYGWKAAERKFNSLVKTGVDPKIIIAAAIRLGQTLKSRVGTEFIPMPASWLNSEDFLESAIAAFDEDAPLNWDAVLRDFKKSGRWSRFAGPDLESPACRAPKELLDKYGLSDRRMDA